MEGDAAAPATTGRGCGRGRGAGRGNGAAIALQRPASFYSFYALV